MTPYLSLISTTKPTDHSTPKLDELITRLPYADELYLDFHPSIETKELEGGDTFYEKHTNYLPLTNVPVFAFYKSSLQRQIKKAQKNLSISSLENIDTFHELYSISLRQRGVNEMTEIDVMTRIWNFAVKNGCGEITIATDSNGQNHAALFCVWDKHIMYYLAGGTDKTYYGSGAMGLLLHHAIIKAQNMGLAIFDFEGSMEKNIDRFFKTFGTTEKKYLSYQSRNSKFLQLLRKMKGR